MFYFSVFGTFFLIVFWSQNKAWGPHSASSFFPTTLPCAQDTFSLWNIFPVTHFPIFVWFFLLRQGESWRLLPKGCCHKRGVCANGGFMGPIGGRECSQQRYEPRKAGALRCLVARFVKKGIAPMSMLRLLCGGRGVGLCPLNGTMEHSNTVIHLKVLSVFGDRQQSGCISLGNPASQLVCSDFLFCVWPLNHVFKYQQI